MELDDGIEIQEVTVTVDLEGAWHYAGSLHSAIILYKAVHND